MSQSGESPEEGINWAEYEDWFAVGGGNFISFATLQKSFNKEQLDVLEALSPTCYRGILLCKVGYPVHYDCHPSDEASFDDELVTKFLALGEKS